MGYQITYGPIKQKTQRRKGMHWALSAVIVFAAAAMLGRVMGLDEMILRLILPGDAAVTAAALETMVSELQSGEAIQEAFAGFCREIIDNAQIY